MPVDDKIDVDEKLADSNPFDVIDEDFLLTDGDMNLLDNNESPMIKSSKKNPLNSSAKKPQPIE